MSSPWSKWASKSTAAYGIGGALLSGAIAGTAYYKRNDLGAGYGWATDHLKYVGTLWDEATLRARLAALAKMNNELGIVFKTYVVFENTVLRVSLMLPVCISDFIPFFHPTLHSI